MAKIIKLKFIFLTTFICCTIHCARSVSDYWINIHSFNIEKNGFQDAEMKMKFRIDRKDLETVFMSRSDEKYEYFTGNNQASELLLLILPSSVAKRVILYKNKVDANARTYLFDQLKKWIISSVGRQVKIFSCSGFSSNRPCGRIISDIIYNHRYQGEPQISPNDYLRVFGVDYLNCNYKNPENNQTFMTLEDSNIIQSIEPFQRSRVQAKIAIYSITNGDFTSEEEEIFMRFDGDDNESYFYQGTELQKHFRWIIVPTSFYQWLNKSEFNQGTMMEYIDQMKLDNSNNGINLEFKLLSVTTLQSNLNEKDLIERALNDHWPKNGTKLSENSAICGLGSFNQEYQDLSSSKQIPSFVMPGLEAKFIEGKSMSQSTNRGTKITVFSFTENDIRTHLREFPMKLAQTDAIEELKEGYSYIDTHENILLLIIPKRVVEQLFQSGHSIQLINFVNNLKQLSNEIDVKLISCSNIQTYSLLEPTIRQFLLRYKNSNGPTSAHVTIFPFGPFRTNDFGYPVFIDETYEPFRIYENPSLTKFFHDIQLYSMPQMPTETMAERFAPSLKEHRKLPWGYWQKREIKQAAVHIFTVDHELREIGEGDYVQFAFRNVQYQPLTTDVPYKYIIDPDPNKHYLFMMVSLTVMERILMKPKIFEIWPKRRQFFEFVNGIKEKSTDLEVKLFAWANVKRSTSKVTVNLLESFLFAHAPNDGRDPRLYITIYGFEYFDVDHCFRKYMNEELTNFFTKIGDRKYNIDVGKATGVIRSGKTARRESIPIEERQTKRLKPNQAYNLQNNLSSENLPQERRSTNLVDPQVWFDDE